jgi:hypothetical protein
VVCYSSLCPYELRKTHTRHQPSFPILRVAAGVGRIQTDPLILPRWKERQGQNALAYTCDMYALTPGRLYLASFLRRSSRTRTNTNPNDTKAEKPVLLAEMGMRVRCAKNAGAVSTARFVREGVCVGGGIAHAPRKICKKRDIFGCRALHRTTTQGTKANTPALVKAAMTQRPLTMVIWTPSLAFSLTQPYSDIQAGRLGPTPLCFYMLQGLYLCSVD